MNTGAPAAVVQVSAASGQLDVELDTPQPPGSAQVAVRVDSCPLVHIGAGTGQVVAVGVAGPHAVALAQAGV